MDTGHGFGGYYISTVLADDRGDLRSSIFTLEGERYGWLKGLMEHLI
jgi:hypothetical protein